MTVHYNGSGFVSLGRAASDLGARLLLTRVGRRLLAVAVMLLGLGLSLGLRLLLGLLGLELVAAVDAARNSLLFVLIYKGRHQSRQFE